jgi:putative hydrolase of the HAD superfamily
MGRFDAVLFDAGGVLVLPDPTVLRPLLSTYGGADNTEAHRRAHYAGMAHKSRLRSTEQDWGSYNEAYVASLGIDGDLIAHAAEVLDHTRSAHLWRWPIPETRTALIILAEAAVPMGVVSNASGQIADMLLRTCICQEGEGPGVEMRVVIDSHVVGVAKPDPKIFDFALPHFSEFDLDRIVYVGDSVTMDIASARGAGLHPVLVDPYDDHPDADFERVTSVEDIVDWF